MPTIKGFDINGNTYTYQDKNIAPEWASGWYYEYGQIVYYNGILYKCLSGNSSDSFSYNSWEPITLSEAVNYYNNLLREEFNDTLNEIGYSVEAMKQVIAHLVTPPLIKIDLSEVSEGNIYETYADRSINLVHFEKDEEGRICQIHNSMDDSTVNITWEKEEADL